MTRRRAPVRSIAAATVVLLAATLGAPLATPRSAREGVRHYERGQARLLHGKYIKAERSFQRALEHFPELPEALLGLGHLRMMRRQFDEALRFYERADAAWEPSREVLNSIRQQRRGELVAELPPYRRVVETTRDGETIVTYIPTRIRVPGSGYDRRRKQRSRPPDLDHHIGNALFELGRVDEAIERWRACIEVDGLHQSAHFNLAVALGSRGDVDDALEMLDRAIELGYPARPGMRDELERAWRSPP